MFECIKVFALRITINYRVLCVQGDYFKGKHTFYRKVLLFLEVFYKIIYQISK